MLLCPVAAAAAQVGGFGRSLEPGGTSSARKRTIAEESRTPEITMCHRFVRFVLLVGAAKIIGLLALALALLLKRRARRGDTGAAAADDTARGAA
jgi:hypothetical protein